MLGAFPASAEIYLTTEQALALVCGASAERVHDPRPIDDALFDELKELGVVTRFSTRTANFFLCKSKGKTSAYALIDNELGKHLPITYVVGISPAGEVTRVDVMVYREVRGWEVRERKFLEQFNRKRAGDPMTIGTGLTNVSGATISVMSMSRGVRRALELWRRFYGERT